MLWICTIFDACKTIGSAAVSPYNLYLIVVLHKLNDNSNVIWVVLDWDYSHNIGSILCIWILAIFVCQYETSISLMNLLRGENQFLLSYFLNLYSWFMIYQREFVSCLVVMQTNFIQWYCENKQPNRKHLGDHTHHAFFIYVPDRLLWVIRKLFYCL
jgi:hypothetical protein